jgi:hypothetical protein
VGTGLAAYNLHQVVSYQPVWRNGETLWQYHVALPGHGAKAYESLAAYYYADFSDAVARQNEPQMAASLHKMSVVVEAGLQEFWPDQRQAPPPATYFLFFLRSLIEEVKGEPDAALASLLMSDRLHPNFDSTNLNLSQLYRKLAGTATNPEQKKTYTFAARDRFATYLKLVYRGRQPPPEANAEMAALEAGCMALANETTVPAPANP